MHTVNSDGKLTTRERVCEAYDYGYDVIAITDHGNSKSYRAALAVGNELGMIVIRGLETGIAGKEHLVAIGISSEYSPRNPHNWVEQPDMENVFYQDELRRIADAGGVVIYAHPHCGFREPICWGVEQGLIQGLEVYNKVVGSGWNTEASRGIYCYPTAFDWALEHNMAVFADSDSHDVRFEEEPVTLVLAKERSVAGVLDAIRQRRTVAWFKDMLWGREIILSQMIRAMVEIKKSEDGRLTIQNNSPVPLKASGVTQTDTIDLPHGGVYIGLGNAVGKSMTITWMNVWTSSESNLKTTHEL
ncbi:MAG: PHP domain-containing protein [Armatimonadota bacterium]